ncbi:MAG TPA: sulfite exporter TauE/SafE family protein [Stellaceae bacterium]|jgi:uncharacterized membrane protein YfcA|nr:sulfite exporter TauE/SafE family protein [Stellaceae bacterium]
MRLARFRPIGIAAVAGLLVGLLSGVIGVGGGELRLPVLIAILGFAAKVAAPINLIVTIITLAGGIAARLAGDVFAETAGFAAEAVVLALGAAPAAYFGAALLRRLNNRKLARVLAVLLLAIGVLMMAESLLGDGAINIAVHSMPARLVLCLVIGAAVGIVVGLLGVGGNELMIPFLVIVLGLPIKEAGSISLLISIPVVLVSLWRFQALRAFKHRDRDVMRTIVPLALGSVAGALGGGLLAPSAPNGVLKFLLGAILLFSAWRTYVHRDDKA